MSCFVCMQKLNRHMIEIANSRVLSKKNIGCHYLQIYKQLLDWCEKVENADIN